MRRLSLILLPVALAVAACTPTVASAPEPSCSAHVESVPAGIHVWGESSIAKGTPITIEIWGNGALLGSYFTTAGYTGRVDAVGVSQPHPFPVHWEGRVVYHDSVLCSAVLDA